MPKVNLEQFVQEKYDPALMREMMRNIEDAINRLSESRAYQKTNAASTDPATSGDGDAYTVGDFVPNNNITEQGSAGSMYLLIGWYCLADGSPGVWREARVLTGN